MAPAAFVNGANSLSPCSSRAALSVPPRSSAIRRARRPAAASARSTPPARRRTTRSTADGRRRRADRSGRAAGPTAGRCSASRPLVALARAGRPAAAGTGLVAPISWNRAGIGTRSCSTRPTMIRPVRAPRGGRRAPAGKLTHLVQEQNAAVRQRDLTRAQRVRSAADQRAAASSCGAARGTAVGDETTAG